MPLQTEIEVKFLDVGFADIRERLVENGAKLVVPMRDMRRALIETVDMKARNGFYRLRDEGDKITLTYKQFDSWAAGTIHGAKEIEVIVNDFDATLALLSQADLNPITYQESRRETWVLDDVEVVLDEWPWIPTYIEIEGPSEASVQAAAKKLGFLWDTGVYGSVDVIYEKMFPLMINRGVIDIKEVRFGDEVPAEFLGKAAS